MADLSLHALGTFSHTATGITLFAPQSTKVKLMLTGTVRGQNRIAKYGKAAAMSVESGVRREQNGTLRSGKGGKGGAAKHVASPNPEVLQLFEHPRR